MDEPLASSLEVSHTPGPWTANCFLVTAGPDRICHTGGHLHPIPRRGHEAEANARLIAAAPDLLKALQYYMSQFGQALDAYKIPYSAIQKDADDKARAAILKATSSSSDAQRSGSP